MKVICNSIGKCHLCPECGAAVPHDHDSCEPCPVVTDAKCIEHNYDYVLVNQRMRHFFENLSDGSDGIMFHPLKEYDGKKITDPFHDEPKPYFTSKRNDLVIDEFGCFNFIAEGAEPKKIKLLNPDFPLHHGKMFLPAVSWDDAAISMNFRFMAEQGLNIVVPEHHVMVDQSSLNLDKLFAAVNKKHHYGKLWRQSHYFKNSRIFSPYKHNRNKNRSQKLKK